MERAWSVSVATLGEKLNVSEMRVRRGLEEFSGRNLLRKVPGGAVPIPSPRRTPTASSGAGCLSRASL
jgi:DeoR/GlpR family transcriptional regulator of sugar metabolism